MRVVSKIFLLAAAAALSGCAASSYCSGEQDYATAESVPPLKGADGQPLPESSAALRIPPPPATDVKYAEPYKDADGDERVRCLDAPPVLPAMPPAPPAPPAAEEPPKAEPPKTE